MTARLTLAALAVALALAGCGTQADMTYTAGDVQLSVSLQDYKDRESINIDVVRDPDTGRVTAFTLQSTNSLTSPVAELNAQAALEGLRALSELAASARPGP